MTIEITGSGISVTPNRGITTLKGNGINFSSLLQTSATSAETNLDDIFNAASQKYGVPVGLLKAVAKAESNFNPKATSRCGAMGIMQLMPGTASTLGVTDPYDPEQNIMGGAKFLSQLLRRFDNDTTLAVAAYNAGPGNVVKYNGIPPFKETQNYVKTVMHNLGQDITAGSILMGGMPSSEMTAGDLMEDKQLGMNLENALLSGSFNDDFTNLLGSLGTEASDISDNLMASVYQLQLQMLQSNDKDDQNVIV